MKEEKVEEVNIPTGISYQITLHFKPFSLWFSLVLFAKGPKGQRLKGEDLRGQEVITSWDLLLSGK